MQDINQKLSRQNEILGNFNAIDQHERDESFNFKLKKQQMSKLYYSDKQAKFENKLIFDNIQKAEFKDD